MILLLSKSKINLERCAGKWMNLCSNRSLTWCICCQKASGACSKKRRKVCGSGKLGSPVRYWKVPLERKNDAVSKRSNPRTMGYIKAKIIWDKWYRRFRLG